MATGSMGHIAGTVSLNINPFTASNNVLKAQIKATSAALRAQSSVVDGYGKSINGMRARYATMTTQLRNYTAQLERYKALANDATRSDRQRANAATQANKAAAEINRLRAQMASLNRTIELQANKWTQASAKANGYAKTLTTVGNKMSGVGKSMTTSLTGPMVLGLGYAAKQYADFDDQMIKTKNIIRTSGESAAETQASYNKMIKDARKYSDRYGVSQNKIAAGYEDLVKRGYTSKAAVGVMDSELKASVATGDDFNDVIKVSSSVMESFGLTTTKTGKQIKSAAEMQRRSNRTLNLLSYAADATSTDFQSLGIGMSYVGSTAHQAGFSLKETAVSMGVLSNNGLEADKAGTGLRQVINSLVKPTKGGAAALDKLGLSAKDFVDKSGKMKSIPTIFGKINKAMKLKGIDKNERGKIFKALFGTTGQQAGAILTENYKRVKELTGEAERATKTDYIGDLAKKNMNSAKAQIAIAKESLTNAGMDIAKNLLPVVTPLIKDVGALARSFGKLPQPVQSVIAKFLLVTAAAGPLLVMLGKMTSGVGKVIATFGAAQAMIGRFQTASKLGASGLDLLKQGLSKTAFSAAGAATATGGATTAIAGAGEAATATAAAGTAASLSLGTIALAAGGATLAIGAGIAVWELWGKKMLAASQRSSRWGSDVGSAADHALAKMQSTSRGIEEALTNMDTASHTTAKSMSAAFDTEFAQMEKSARDHFAKIKEGEKDLDPTTAKAVDKQANKEIDQYNDYLKDADTAKKNAQKILSTTNGTVADLSASQRTMLRNNQQAMLQDEMKILNITGSAQKKAIAALNGDIKHMSASQRESRETDLRQSMAQMKQHYLSQEKALKEHYGKNSAEYKAGHKANAKALNDYTAKASAEYIKLAKANGESTKQIKADLEAAGLDYKKGNNQLAQAAKNAKDALKGVTIDTQNMTGKTKKAANAWNKLVFDPKTGKVKTNAQDEIAKAVKSKDKWNQIKLLEKQGKLSTNAKQMVAAALVESRKWDSMSWKEQKLWLKDGFSETIVKALEDSGTWNNLDLQTKEAIVKAKGKKEMVDILVQSGAWNTLTLKQQEALVATKGTAGVMDALDQMGRWNTLTPKQQEAIVNAKGGPALANLLTQYGLWEGLPQSVLKQMIAEDKASGNAAAAKNAIKRYNAANPNHKYFRAEDRASGNGKKAIGVIQKWNSLKAHVHKFITEYITKRKKGRARGTNYHEGGPMMVNDQKGPVFRELVQFPGQQPFIPYGRNVIMDAPAGTKVLRASRTAKLFTGLPQFANGTSDAVSILNNLPRELKVTPVTTSTTTVTNVNGSAKGDAYMAQMVGFLSQMADQMGQMVGLNAAQIGAIKAAAMDKNTLYTKMGTDQIYFDAQQL